MWQRFHTEEPSDPPHEGEMIKAQGGDVHSFGHLALIVWVLITNRLTLNNEFLLEKLIVTWLFKKFAPHLHKLNVQYSAFRSPQVGHSQRICPSSEEFCLIFSIILLFLFKIYRTIILPVVLYGCETWSLTLREERRLRVFENRVLRRVFGSKRDEVTGEWRKLHNEELRDLYSLLNIVRVVKSRRMRWSGNVARMGEGRGVHRVLVGKPEGKRPLGRPRRRWEDNIKMDLREVGRGGGDWMELAQDRDRWRALVNTVMKLRVP